VDPVPLVFRLFQTTSVNDAASAAVGFQGAGQGCCCREFNDRLQHFHDVVHRVFFVVKNDDVIRAFPLR